MPLCLRAMVLAGGMPTLWAVSNLWSAKTSKHQEAAIELVRFLTSTEIQRVNAKVRGYATTRPDIYEDQEVPRSDPFFRTLQSVLLKRRGHPAIAGARYEEMPTAYFSRS
jgi:trehalose/maltose transport system substrate-binding protein